MTAPLATHSIRVLGRDLQVKSAARPERVAEVADLVNAKLSEAERAINSKDTQLVVILALMNIAEAYLALKSEQEEGTRALEERVASLVTLLDQAG